MTEWIKAGVCGDLQPQAQKVKGRIIRLYESKGQDFYLTCVRDGNHSAGNFHEIGLAFDFRYAEGVTVTEKEIIEAAGKNCDCVFHTTHVHVEYDPK